MSRAVRVTLSVLIAAVAVVAVDRLCYARYVCNLSAGRAERSLSSYFVVKDEVAARIAARQTIEDMDHCIPSWCTNVAFYMARGAALRMLGRPAEAQTEYRRALKFDRRAELYFNLGLAEMESGRDAEALDALTTAVLVQRTLLDDIPTPMQDRVRANIAPVYEMIERKTVPPDVAKQLRARVIRDPA